MMRTDVTRLGGQCAMGPIGVLLQSKLRMRSPISPPPEKILDGETGLRGASRTSASEIDGFFVLFWLMAVGDFDLVSLLETLLMLPKFHFLARAGLAYFVGLLVSSH
jgi:hypothetical protein